VPTCPDWTLKQLFRHVGRGNRRRRRSSPTRDRKPPEDPDARRRLPEPAADAIPGCCGDRRLSRSRLAGREPL